MLDGVIATRRASQLLHYFFRLAAFLRARAAFAFMALISLAALALARLASFVALAAIFLAALFGSHYDLLGRSLGSFLSR